MEIPLPEDSKVAFRIFWIASPLLVLLAAGILNFVVGLPTIFFLRFIFGESILHSHTSLVAIGINALDIALGITAVWWLWRQTKRAYTPKSTEIDQNRPGK
jgi:hypothetical protein